MNDIVQIPDIIRVIVPGPPEIIRVITPGPPGPAGSQWEVLAFPGVDTIDPAITEALSFTPPKTVRLAAGIFELRQPINRVDSPKAIVIRGAGWRNTLIWGNFTGAGKAILDLGFSDNALRIDGHILDDFAMCSNGVVGDPIAIRMDRISAASLRRIHTVGKGDPIAGATRLLLNTGLVMTEVNNSDVTECTFKSGYQPTAFDIGTTVRFSLTAGSNVCTATENVFTSAMIGETIVFPDGGGAPDFTDFFYSTIASVAGTTCTLATPAGGDASLVPGSIGFITGNMTAGNNLLTINRPILVAGHEGMRINIPLAHIKPLSGATHGLLCTSIQTVLSPTTCRLAGTPDATPPANIPIYFAPNMLLGRMFEQEADTRNINDLNFNYCEFENNQAAGVIANRMSIIRFRGCKFEGEYPGVAPNVFTRSMTMMVLSEVGSLFWDGGAINYSMHPTYGSVWIMGSRGCATFSETECTGKLKDQPFVYVDDQCMTQMEVVINNLRYLDGLGKHSVDYAPNRVPTTHLRAVQYNGAVLGATSSDRSWRPGRSHPGYEPNTWYNGGYTPDVPSAPQAPDTLYAQPIRIGEAAIIQAFGARIDTGVAATQLRVGLYENVVRDDLITTRCRPGKLLAQVSAPLSGATSVAVSQPLAKNYFVPIDGWYWLVALVDGALRARAIKPAANYNISGLLGGGSIDQIMANTANVTGLQKPSPFAGGLPADLTGDTSWVRVTTAICPILAWQAG